MDYLPIFLQLENKHILVVGGGEVACRKVDLLLKAKAKVHIVSPKLHSYLQHLLQAEKVSYQAKCFDEEDLLNIDMLFATTDSFALNQQIYTLASQKKIWVNAVDSPDFCHFITPSIVDRSPIQVAISSEGKSPVLIRYLREKLEGFLPQNLSLVADFAGEKREVIKTHFQTLNERRRFWERFFSFPLVENATHKAELESAFACLLKQENAYFPTITLVHAGTDPELLTIKALRLMQEAEFVVFDARLDEVFLELCRRDADRVLYQNAQECLSVLQAKQGKVRLCILSADKDSLALAAENIAPSYSYQQLCTVDAK